MSVEKKGFDKLKEFVVSLYETFNENKVNIKSLECYHKVIISKSITIEQKNKIIDSWTHFCKSNESSFKEKKDVFNPTKVVYSGPLENKIYIDFNVIFKESRLLESQGITMISTIWEYLILINSILNPSKEAKLMTYELNKTISAEDEFIQRVSKTDSEVDFMSIMSLLQNNELDEIKILEGLLSVAKAKRALEQKKSISVD